MSSKSPAPLTERWQGAGPAFVSRKLNPEDQEALKVQNKATKPSIFHLLASTVKLGQHRAAQRSGEPAPKISPLSKPGALRTRAAGEETGCFEKPQPGDREIRALWGAGVSSGTERDRERPEDTTLKVPPGQRSAQTLPAPAPAFTVAPLDSKASPV